MSVSPLTCTMFCVLNLRQNPDATTFRKKMRCLVEGEWLLTNTAEYCCLAAFFHLAFYQHDCGFTALASSKKYVCGPVRATTLWCRVATSQNYLLILCLLASFLVVQPRCDMPCFLTVYMHVASCDALASWQRDKNFTVTMHQQPHSSIIIINLQVFLFHPLLIYSLLLFFRATLSSSWCLLNLMIFGPSHGAMWEHMTMRIMLLVWAVLAKMRLFTIGFLTCPDGAFGTDSEWMMCISTGSWLVYPNLDVFFGKRATKRTLRMEFWDRWLLWQPPVLASIHTKLWSLVSLDRWPQIWQTICSLGLMFNTE